MVFSICGFNHTFLWAVSSKSCTELYSNYLLIELWPLKELLKLSTEPPAFNLGLSRESTSGCDDWGDSGITSRLESWKKYHIIYANLPICLSLELFNHVVCQLLSTGIEPTAELQQPPKDPNWDHGQYP